MTTILTPTGEITAGFPTTTSTTGRTADRSRWNSITHVVRMKTIIDDAWCPNSRRTLPSRGKDIHEAAASTSTRQQCTDRTTASSAGRRTAHSTRLDPLTALQSRLVWSSSLLDEIALAAKCHMSLGAHQRSSDVAIHSNLQRKPRVTSRSTCYQKQCSPDHRQATGTLLQTALFRLASQPTLGPLAHPWKPCEWQTT
mmetsp:Transcript_56189/g.116087  ORF Transcript_56189/g.116087 Transcript_56189/m.116087 type:complete len:198 (+) Transcript_56189:447-1040(+)